MRSRWKTKEKVEIFYRENGLFQTFGAQWISLVDRSTTFDPSKMGKGPQATSRFGESQFRFRFAFPASPPCLGRLLRRRLDRVDRQSRIEYAMCRVEIGAYVPLPLKM